MNEVRIGTLLCDNDPRHEGRVVKVEAIYKHPGTGDTFYVWRSKRRINRINSKRIGNKPNGWSLV